MAIKKQRKKWWLLIPLFLLLIYLSWVYYQHVLDEKARFSVYPGFGIELPLGYSLHGIDVSFYQQHIYWPSVKKMKEKDVALKFVFIKATEGLYNADRYFKRNWEQAKSLSLTRGAYHFFLATKDGTMQAKNFLKKVQLKPGDLPPVLDIEELYGVAPDVMRRRVKDWLKYTEKYCGVKPIIYSNAFFYEHYLGKEFSGYPLWVAHYFEKKKPGVTREWTFWQHNDAGKVNGIAAKVDFNVYNGDSVSFQKMLIQ